MPLRSLSLFSEIRSIDISIRTSILYEISTNCDLYIIFAELYIFLETIQIELNIKYKATKAGSETKNDLFFCESNDNNNTTRKSAGTRSEIKNYFFFCEVNDDNNAKYKSN